MIKISLKKFLTISGSNKFGYKDKIGEFKYTDIKDLVNNIKNNTNSEIDAKKSLNALNKIKNAEIKYKRLIPKQKELLNLLNDLLDTILTDKTLESKTQKDENDETLMASNEDDENDETMSSNEDDENKDDQNDETLTSSNEDDDDETMNQNKKNEIIKQSNDTLDEIIDKLKSKPFEEQIKSLKK